MFLSVGEAVQNASGFGLYFVNDKPKWDLTCNIRISKVHVRHFEESTIITGVLFRVYSM